MQLVKYDVHTTRKIKFVHAICYHILLLSLKYRQLSCTGGSRVRGMPPPKRPNYNFSRHRRRLTTFLAQTDILTTRKRKGSNIVATKHVSWTYSYKNCFCCRSSAPRTPPGSYQRSSRLSNWISGEGERKKKLERKESE